MEHTDNTDGSIDIDHTTATVSAEVTQVDDNTATLADNIVTLAGDFEDADDTASVTINGITATYT